MKKFCIPIRNKAFRVDDNIYCHECYYRKHQSLYNEIWQLGEKYPDLVEEQLERKGRKIGHLLDKKRYKLIFGEYWNKDNKVYCDGCGAAINYEAKEGFIEIDKITCNKNRENSKEIKRQALEIDNETQAAKKSSRFDWIEDREQPDG